MSNVLSSFGEILLMSVSTKIPVRITNFNNNIASSSSNIFNDEEIKSLQNKNSTLKSLSVMSSFPLRSKLLFLRKLDINKYNKSSLNELTDIQI